MGMGKPYSMDLRQRVVAAIEGGLSTRQAAARFAIGIATAGTWARLKRATGAVRPAKQGKPKGAVLDAHADFILGALAEAPDTTLDEMVERLREERGVTVVRTAVWKLLDGPMDGESFRAWVEQMLAPTLRPDDIVVMDNLAAHQVAGVRQAIEACGAELRYLPPYSPDFNPIENAFAKLKAHVRKSAARNRAQFDTLAQRIETR